MRNINGVKIICVEAADVTLGKDIVVRRVSTPKERGFCLGQQWSSAVTYVLAAGVAVLGVEGLEAVAAVGAAVLHDVALAAKRDFALKAAEVLHVPVPALRFGAFVSKDDLHQVQYKVY